MHALAHDASLMIAVGKNGGLVSKINAVSDAVLREEKRGICYYEICKKAVDDGHQ